MEIFIKGNYKSFIKLLVYPSKKRTQNVLVNIHGVYGLSGDVGSKSRKLAELVSKKGLAHVVLISSSRNWKIFEDGNWDRMKEAFTGKTFEQELQDVKDALDLLLDQSESLFDVNESKLKLLLLGNSLGGTIATCLSDYFDHIPKIMVAGSGTRTVFESKITEDDILKSASKFEGKFLLLQGSKDETVPLKAGDALLAGYKKASTKKIVIEGANHNFSKINGKNKTLANKSYIDEVVKFFLKK
jgi:dienelactone hydrolase